MRWNPCVQRTQPPSLASWIILVHHINRSPHFRTRLVRWRAARVPTCQRVITTTQCCISDLPHHPLLLLIIYIINNNKINYHYKNPPTHTSHSTFANAALARWHTGQGKPCISPMKINTDMCLWMPYIMLIFAKVSTETWGIVGLALGAHWRCIVINNFKNSIIRNR